MTFGFQVGLGPRQRLQGMEDLLNEQESEIRMGLPV